MKAKLLHKLRNTDGYISGQALCDEFGVTRTAVWKAIEQLRSEGYVVDAVRNKGYKLLEVPELLSKKEIESMRETRWLGSRIEYHEQLDSTNNEAKRIAEMGAEHGTVVVTDEQTAGRGRMGRGFSSPPGQGLWFTYILRPEMEPSNASMLTIVKAMAVRKALTEITGLDIRIKWPNDIVCDGRKLCGILTEMSAQPEMINYVVIGSGINVLNGVFPENIRDRAVSLFMLTGKRYNRAEILEKVNEAFEEYYEQFMQEKNLGIIAALYNSCMAGRGSQVTVTSPHGEISGVARGITDRGELMIERDNRIEYITSGEVSVKGIYGV